MSRPLEPFPYRFVAVHHREIGSDEYTPAPPPRVCGPSGISIAWEPEPDLAIVAREVREMRARLEVLVGLRGDPPPGRGRGERSRSPKRLSKVRRAIVILQFRAARPGESIQIGDIAREAGCSVQNLHQAEAFMRVYREACALRAGAVRRGRKVDGAVDGPE
jgi:hypothetical protein